MNNAKNTQCLENYNFTAIKVRCSYSGKLVQKVLEENSEYAIYEKFYTLETSETDEVGPEIEKSQQLDRIIKAMLKQNKTDFRYIAQRFFSA